YYLRGPLLALTWQEGLLRRVIDLDRRPAGGEPPVARELRLLGADRSLAALWVNPRAFQADLEAKAAASRGEEAAVLRTTLTYWKALDGIALSLALEKDLALSLAVRANPEQ